MAFGLGRGGAAPAAPAMGGGGSYGTIGGPLPFSGGGDSYEGAYNAALNFNKANYSQILSGYQQTAANQQAAQGPIGQGYWNLKDSVLGGIQGIDASQRQQINNQYAQARGQASQQLINRGLGNSTVQQSVDRGLMANRDLANLELTNQTQGLNAQYGSQLGSQALNYYDRANMQNTGQANQQLAWLNSINAGYPDASSFAKMAQMKGMSGAGAQFGVSAPIGGGNRGGSQTGVTAPPYYYGGGGGGYGGYGMRTPTAAGAAPSPWDVYPAAAAQQGVPKWFPMGGELATGLGYDPSGYMVGTGGGDLPSPFESSDSPYYSPQRTGAGLDENGDPVDTSEWY